MFLEREDIQLGVNESTCDSARVIGGMCQGIFTRVGAHEEIEVRRFSQSFSAVVTLMLSQELAKYLPVPVLNALSSLWHPTQVLADLLTLQEFYQLPKLRPLTVAYVGDSANILHDMLVSFPRLGHIVAWFLSEVRTCCFDTILHCSHLCSTSRASCRLPSSSTSTSGKRVLLSLCYANVTPTSRPSSLLTLRYLATTFVWATSTSITTYSTSTLITKPESAACVTCQRTASTARLMA